jgi:zinc transport system ATP-binding protein
MNNPAIEVSQVLFGYSAKEAVLRNVSFTIEKGQFVGVIGPNGGGKSTLLKLLLGLMAPWSGSVSIYGKPPPTTLMAYVPQVFSSDKAFPITVLEVVLGGRMRYVSSWGKFQKEDVDFALQALSQVGLHHLQEHSFGALSGGQAQRVLIARALASRPQILLLDEPTSSTDREAESAIFETILQLKKDLTILMVTHNISRILGHVEQVLCVNGTVSSLPPKEICEHFAIGLYHEPILEAHSDLPHRGETV